ncbi:putative lipid-transfer protein Ltp1/thiolase [Mycolicibacterium madagascariense]|uniref:propanoyl-CoA C-acyltransferase n=1 Tax=Mycolicibacterium madagascariense TaxID=212765 RepID=A0A7I7X990_9MYCO|nr:lipid-transfer protein [Mycolicibacterium madagascariense]MCV7013446.1 lipid-transfer protein [Mycolicibacterium madagascariense]BBZ25835.1 putative lipid-transfer protein Ltp1/thiolase [Mycolicibacterium madagascariense]
MTDKVFVIGNGMTKFEKPGRREGWDYPDMALEAGTRALAEAGIAYDQIEQAYAGYCYGESCSGHRAVYGLGLTAIPVFNVNSNCSTGSSALFLAANAIRGGLADCTLAIGFEKMAPGSLGSTWNDRENPMQDHLQAMAELRDIWFPPAPWMFGAAGLEHNDRYGSKPDHFAQVAEKNHRHSLNNPYAQFQDSYTLDEIKNSKMVYEAAGLTRPMCSPTSDGSGAAILASERFVDQHDLGATAVEIIGQAVVSDTPGTFESGSVITLVGADMTRRAARRVYEQADITPDDVDVIELHDCFAPNEVLTYEALDLCGEGRGHELIEAGDTTYGGRWVVNPSGGLISKGHPLGATGLAQCAELSWQLRGLADARQVEGATVALQHNIGLGGSAVVTAYRAPA